MEKANNKKIDIESVADILENIYGKAISGATLISPPIENVAESYLKKYSSPAIAAKKMLNNQVLKCTTSGFVTGLGGVITLAATLPLNITSVIYVQVRMIACTAYMAGYDLNDDQVQTLVYACLAGVAVNELIKNAGLKFGEKIAVNIIKKIPGEVFTKINQKIGFRFITKFGEKGIINMGKLIPGVGGVIGGGFDLIETRIIANRAYRWFFENDFSVNNAKDDEADFIDVGEAEEK